MLYFIMNNGVKAILKTTAFNTGPKLPTQKAYPHFVKFIQYLYFITRKILQMFYIIISHLNSVLDLSKRINYKFSISQFSRD